MEDKNIERLRWHIQMTLENDDDTARNNLISYFIHRYSIKNTELCINELTEFATGKEKTDEFMSVIMEALNLDEKEYFKGG